MDKTLSTHVGKYFEKKLPTIHVPKRHIQLLLGNKLLLLKFRFMSLLYVINQRPQVPTI